MLGRRSCEASSVLVLDGYAEGYLVKQGGRIKTWHTRYFVFHDGSLSYRKHARDGAKVLRRDKIVDVSYHAKVRHGLCVQLASGRALSVSAKCEDQANAWYDVFSEYLTKHRKAKEFQLLFKKRQNMHLDPIEECEDDDETAAIVEGVPLSDSDDTDSDSELWVFEF